MLPVTPEMSGIDTSAESGGIPSERILRDEALVREVKANLAQLHRKIDSMSAQMNGKLDAIMTWHDNSDFMPNGTIDCMPNGTPNGKEGNKQSRKIGPGAMSGKCTPQPHNPLPVASYLSGDVASDIEDVENPNHRMSLGASQSSTLRPVASQLNPPMQQSVQSVSTVEISKSSGDRETIQSASTSKPAEVIGSQALTAIPTKATLLSSVAKPRCGQTGFSTVLEKGDPLKNIQLKWHQRVLNFLEDPDSSRAAFVYSKVMSTVILCSCVLNFAQTIKPPTLNPDVFVPIEMFCDMFFLGEVSMRFMATPNKIGFFMSYHNCIDVVSSGPPLILRALTQYTPYSTSDAADEIRYVILCISPVFRMLKMLRRWNKFNLLMCSGFSLVSEVMPVLLVILFILALSFSSMVYFVEPRDNIDALPKALWFTIITMSTVGYGDVVPQTTVGNIITLILVICSALYMAVPLGIAGNAFSKVWEDRDWLLLVKYMHDRLTVNNYQARDIPDLFRAFGNDNGEIALGDFVRMIFEMDLGIQEDRILDLFFSFDSDNSGTIDAMEFIKVIFPSQFVQMYGRSSKRHSGRVSQISRYSSRSDSVWINKVASTEVPREGEVVKRTEGSFDETHSAVSSTLHGIVLVDNSNCGEFHDCDNGDTCDI